MPAIYRGVQYEAVFVFRDMKTESSDLPPVKRYPSRERI